MPSPPPGTMGVNNKRPVSKRGSSDVGQNDAEENEQDHEAGSGSTSEAATQPRSAEEPVGPAWSQDTGDFEDCLFACFCPCIVTGRNLALLDIGVSFVKGCVPVG